MPPNISQQSVPTLDEAQAILEARLAERGIATPTREIGALDNFGNAFYQSLVTAPRVAFNELTGDVRESGLVQRRADRSNPVRPGTSQFLGSIAGGLVPNIAAIGAAPFTGGASLGAAAALQGMTAAGQTKLDIREFEERTGKDISTLDTNLSVGINGVLVGLFSRFGLGRVTAGVGSVSKEISKLASKRATGELTKAQFKVAIAGKIAKAVPGSSAIEAGEEGVEQVVQNITDQFFGTQTRTLGQDVGMSALGGAIGGAILGPAGVGIGASSAIGQGRAEGEAQVAQGQQQADDTQNAIDSEPEARAIQAALAAEVDAQRELAERTVAIPEMTVSDVQPQQQTGRLPGQDVVAGQQVSDPNDMVAIEEAMAVGDVTPQQLEGLVIGPDQAPVDTEFGVEQQQRPDPQVEQEASVDVEGPMRVEETGTPSRFEIPPERLTSPAEEGARVAGQEDVAIEEPMGVTDVEPQPRIATPEVRHTRESLVKLKAKGVRAIAVEMGIPNAKKNRMDANMDAILEMETPISVTDPTIVTPAIPPSPEVNVSAQEDVVSTTAQTPTTPAEGDTGAAKASPTASSEGTTLPPKSQQDKTGRTTPPQRERGIVAVPDIKPVTDAIASGAKFTASHVKTAGQWLASQGAKAFSSFKSAAASLVKMFGPDIRRFTARIMGAAKKFYAEKSSPQRTRGFAALGGKGKPSPKPKTKTQAAKEINSTGDLGKSSDADVRKKVVGTKKDGKPKTVKTRLSDEVHDAIRDETKTYKGNSSKHSGPKAADGTPLREPAVIGSDPAKNSKVRAALSGAFGPVSNLHLEWLSPPNIISKISSNPIVRNALYWNLKRASTRRNELVNKFEKVSNTVLGKIGMQPGTAKHAKMSAMGAGVHSALFGTLKGKTPGRTKADVVDTKLGKNTFAMTGAERANLAASILEPSQRESLIRTGISFGRFKHDKTLRANAKKYRVTEEDLVKFEKSLSKDEKALREWAIEQLREHKKSLVSKFQSDLKAAIESNDKSAIAEAEFMLKKMDEFEFYFPTKRDFDLADRKDAKRSSEQGDDFDFNTGNIGEAVGFDKQSFLKNRTNQTTAPMEMRDIFQVVKQHARQAASFVEMDSDIKAAREALQGTKAMLVSRKDGQALIDNMTDLYAAVVEDVSGNRQRTTEFEKLERKINKQLTIGYLGWNAVTKMKQLASYASAATELGWSGMMAGMRVSYKTNNTNEATDNSAMLADRFFGANARLHLTPETSAEGESQSNFEQKAMKWIKDADWRVIMGIWAGAKIEYQKANPGKPIDLQAVARRVEHIVSTTQPSFDIMDVTRLQRRARNIPGLKTGLMFTTQRFQNLNVMVKAYGDLREGVITPKQWASKMATMAIVTPAILFAAEEPIRQLLGTGAEDAEEMMARMKKTWFSTNVGNVPIFSSAVTFFMDKLENTFSESDFSKTPNESFFEDMMTNVARLVNDSTKDDARGMKGIAIGTAAINAIPIKPANMMMQLYDNRIK